MNQFLILSVEGDNVRTPTPRPPKPAAFRNCRRETLSTSSLSLIVISSSKPVIAVQPLKTIEFRP